MRDGIVKTSRLLLAGLLAGAGCGKPEAPEEIVALCGGSFRPPAEQLARACEKETGLKVTLSFGQSEDLLPHVKNHAQGDVFLTHDPYAKYAADAKAESRTVTVGHLRPVLVVAKGNAHGIRGVEDLARPGLRVALPHPEYSTCGEMVVKALDRKGIKDKVMANVGNALFRSHGEIAGAVKMGHRDAGMIWNGVARNWLDSLEVVPTPSEYEEVRVTVTGLSYSKNQKGVERFLAYAERKGPEIFGEFGYVR